MIGLHGFLSDISNRVTIQWTNNLEPNSTWTFPISFTSMNYAALGGIWIDGYATMHATKTVSTYSITVEEKTIQFTTGSFAIGY